MAEYLAPGVYVEEEERGAAPLEGVSTSTAGFLGPTERGPTDPRLLTSFADYERTFGEHLPDSYLASAVEGFFANGGSRCFLGRITAEEDRSASAGIPLGTPFDDRLPTVLTADRIELAFGSVDGDEDSTEPVVLKHTGDTDDDPIEVVLDDDVTVESTMEDTGFSYAWEDDTGDGETQVIEPGEDGKQLDVTFEPESDTWRHWARLVIDPGGDVEPVAVTLTGENADESDADVLSVDKDRLDFGMVDPDEDDGEATLDLVVQHEGGEDIELNLEDSIIIGPDHQQYDLDDDGTITLGQEDDDDDTPGPNGDVEPETTVGVTFSPNHSIGGREATLLLDHDGDNAPIVIELSGWTDEAVDVDAVGPGEWGDHVAIVIEDASMYEPGRNELFKLKIRYWRDADDYADAKAGDADPDNDEVASPDVEEVFDDLSPHESSSNFYVQQVNNVSVLVDLEKTGKGRPDPAAGPIWLDGGEDNEIERGDYEGDATLPPEDRTGFAGFEKLDELAIVCIPDEHEHDVTDPLIEHCHAMDDRFAILQAEANPGPVGDLRPPEDTDMGAFYYPWVEVIDPITGMVEEMPPGGHIAGIFARSDANHGVHKAPANEVIRGIEGLQRTITKGEQEVLNPRGVNCLRAFRGRGIRVWGARTASSNPNWRYVNVRRLFLFLRGSIEEGTQWVVFEPNNEQLWARVRQTIKNFLTDVWEDGALMGTSPDEAFFVKCDRSTMTQSDIENGRLICEIGVAPVRPAEFVIFRISQWTGSAD